MKCLDVSRSPDCSVHAVVCLPDNDHDFQIFPMMNRLREKHGFGHYLKLTDLKLTATGFMK